MDTAYYNKPCEPLAPDLCEKKIMSSRQHGLHPSHSLGLPVRHGSYPSHELDSVSRETERAFHLGYGDNFSLCIGQEYYESGYTCLEKQDEADLCLNAHQTRYATPKWR